nr:MAG TPA: hypothetical protein [Caudoviricetes sp.]
MVQMEQYRYLHRPPILLFISVKEQHTMRIIS